MQAPLLHSRMNVLGQGDIYDHFKRIAPPLPLTPVLFSGIRVCPAALSTDPKAGTEQFIPPIAVCRIPAEGLWGRKKPLPLLDLHSSSICDSHPLGWQNAQPGLPEYWCFLFGMVKTTATHHSRQVCNHIHIYVGVSPIEYSVGLTF